MSFYGNMPAGGALEGAVPTLFEVLAAQEVDGLLPVALRYVLVKYWAERRPGRWSLACAGWFDEWGSLGLKGALEWYHLGRHDAAFVDKYYGLQQYDCSGQEGARAYISLALDGKLDQWPQKLRLKRSQRLVLWLQRVLAPYLRAKLDALHARLQVRDALSPVQQWFKRLYPHFKRAWLLLDLCARLAFLSGATQSTSLLEWVFKVGYTRVLVPLHKEQVADQQGDTRPPHYNSASVRHDMRTLLSQGWRVAAFTGSQVFPSCMFALKVYQWWIGQDLTTKLLRQINSIDKEIPRPPTDLTLRDLGSGNCPVCSLPITNPAIIETGFTMCYPCAVGYLREHEGRCPVTDARLLGCTYNADSGEWDVLPSVRKLLL